MSQSGNVLHLYVEVRSAPDQNGGKSAFGVKEEGLSAVQDSPAKLLSKLASQNVTKTPAAQRCPHGPSPSRNIVSFRPQPSSGSPSVNKRWSAPCDEVYCLHSSPKASSCASPGCRTFSKQGSGGGDGKRSVVTFSYVEKSNVKTLDSPCKSFQDKGPREERSTPSRFRKGLSDPVWFGSPDSSCSSSPKMTFCSPRRHQQAFSPGFCRSELDPIGRAATRRAVEEFGSPLLRIKLAHALEMASSRCTRQQRCQSWAGSPVQRQNITAVDPKSQAAVQSQILSQSRPTPTRCVEAQSPRWCYKDNKVPAGSPATQKDPNRTSIRSGLPQEAILPLGNNVPVGLNQLSDSKSSSPAHSPVVARRLAEEATKVSSIFSEVRRSMLHNSFVEEEHIQQSKQTLKMNIPLNDYNMPAPDNTDRHQPPSSTPALRQMNQEGRDWGSLLPTSQTSPAIPSRVFRPSHPPTEVGSPMRDPRLLQADLRAPDTPTLHRRQLPPYTRESWSSALTNREVLSSSERGDCTELARRLYINQSVEEAPISWTSRQHWGHRVEDNPDTELSSWSVKEQQPAGVLSSQRHQQAALSPTSQQKRAEQRRREILLLGPVALDSAEEDEGCDEEEQGNELEGLEERQQECLQQRPGEPQVAEQNGAMGGSSSRSSSGVTGSLADRDCVSPESSHSSHQSNETGAATSGIQVMLINCSEQFCFGLV